MARAYMSDVRRVVAKLAEIYKPAGALRDPLQLILWENIGYLIDDERRAVLFAEFKSRVGLTASEIKRAPSNVLIDIARRGGMNPQTRIERWQTIAQIAMDDAGGDLGAALKALLLPEARALLKKFPAIGNPGADKVLLFRSEERRVGKEC